MRGHLVVLLVVWLLSASYASFYLKRGWVPHDEGALAQSAERVLQGELPHRDFDELYTGGLSALNALAFRGLGANLASPRIVLFAFFLAWVPAVHWIALRFTSTLAAAGITLLAVGWSLPNYSAAVPSWYNLFFATFGTAALFRCCEISTRRWLFVAGLCGGLSFLAKLSGLYYIAGALLFLVFREQQLSHEEHSNGRGRTYSVFVSAVLLTFITLLFAVIRSRFGGAEFVHFVLPGAALAALLLWREVRTTAGSNSKRFAALFGMLLPFAAGVALPVAIFVAPYHRSGALSALAHGVFFLPVRRLGLAAWSPLGLGTLPALIPLVALLGFAMYWQGRIPRSWIVALAMALGTALGFATRDSSPYQFIWHGLVFLLPFTVLAGAILLGNSRVAEGRGSLRQQQVFLLLSVTALCGLVQFPFSAPIYFCYVAPLLALALLALFSLRDRPPRFLLGTALTFYLLFAVLVFTPGFIHAMGYRYIPDPETRRLSLLRAGGLRVNSADASEYERLIPLVQQRAGGEFIYAAPDCPEVYFLSGLRNPTHTLFDFFDDPVGRTERILSVIEMHRVNEVVLHADPEFSAPLAPDLRTALVKLFPESTSVGNFEVRWR